MTELKAEYNVQASLEAEVARLEAELQRVQDYAADLEAQVEVLEDELERWQKRYRLAQLVIRVLKQDETLKRTRWEQELHPLARWVQRVFGKR